MANVGGTGLNEFVGEKRKLVLRGNKLVVVDGRLILGPCDISHGGEMPMTESLVIVFNGKMYQTFAQYLTKYPGAFMHLGIRNGELGSGAEHHNTYFDVDEDALPTGVACTVRFVTALNEAGFRR